MYRTIQNTTHKSGAMMKCLYPSCNTDVEGRKSRKFCSDKHRQAYFRQQHKQDQEQGLLSELAELRAKVQEQEATIQEQEQEITRLLNRLDIKRRLFEDHERRGFISWLKKQPARTIGELGQHIRDDETLPSAGSRAGYRARLQAKGYIHSQDDIDQFNDLWTLMLL